jgi:hypothetical protein
VIRTGENLVDGVPVFVERRRVRRTSVCVEEDGRVAVVVPKWGATLRDAEAFLRSKWKWVLRHRAEALARPRVERVPPSESEVASLRLLLAELNGTWTARLGEAGVTWHVLGMKTLWGSCHIAKRRIAYNSELAKAPREMVEYVVVHELTHLKSASHGPLFYRLMDERLPGWRELRRRLNRREFGSAADAPRPAPPAPRRVVQCEFDFFRKDA